MALGDFSPVWTVPPIARTDEPLVADERTMLESFLDWHRTSLLHRCTGLTAKQLALQAVPPSDLSLLGLIRHLTDVERTWFRRRFHGEQLDPVYAPPGKPDAAFQEIDRAGAQTAVETLLDEWELCRQAVKDASLDDTFISERWGEMSLRWVYLHMIREYAQHNGHADLLRERIDGQTGW